MFSECSNFPIRHREHSQHLLARTESTGFLLASTYVRGNHFSNMLFFHWYDLEFTSHRVILKRSINRPAAFNDIIRSSLIPKLDLICLNYTFMVLGSDMSII